MTAPTKRIFSQAKKPSHNKYRTLNRQKDVTHNGIGIDGRDGGDAAADVGVLGQVAVAVGVNELWHEVVADDVDGDVGVDSSEASGISIVTHRHHSLPNEQPTPGYLRSQSQEIRLSLSLQLSKPSCRP